MAAADFYLIDKPRFRENPLLLVCELAKKAFEAQLPTLIHCRSREQAEQLDELLWEFDADAFLPHQIAGEGEDDEITAILLVAPEYDAPMRSLVINLRDSCAPAGFQSVKEVVAAESSEREGSRARWKEYQARGLTLRKFDM
jgi:DNA polymerase III subunit chi